MLFKHLWCRAVKLNRKTKPSTANCYQFAKWVVGHPSQGALFHRIIDSISWVGRDPLGSLKCSSWPCTGWPQESHPVPTSVDLGSAKKMKSTFPSLALYSLFPWHFTSNKGKGSSALSNEKNGNVFSHGGKQVGKERQWGNHQSFSDNIYWKIAILNFVILELWWLSPADVLIQWSLEGKPFYYLVPSISPCYSDRSEGC